MSFRRTLALILGVLLMSAMGADAQTSDAPPRERSVAAASLFSDVIARNVGDIVTVLVIEKASATKSASTETKRSTSKRGNISALPIPSHTWLGRRSALLEEGFQLGGESSYTGGGSISRKETLKAEVSTLVKEVLPNGNLVLEGHRTITVNGETQLISVRGIARPEDIQSDNTIYSMYLVNPEITYTGKGILSGQKPGWLSRVLDWIWPF